MAFSAEILVESEVSYDYEVSPRRNLHALHVPEAHDRDVAPEAIRSAVHAFGYPADEVSASYFPKVDRFGAGRR